MRRVLSSVVVVGGVVGACLGLTGAPALAAPARVCTIDDSRTNELSGMVATKTGYVVINDSTEVQSHDQIFFLSSKCKVTRAVPYTGKGSRDPEDLALSADGRTLWVADIGDNVDAAERRTSVVLWSLPVEGTGKPVLHRLAYPGNKPHDAEALLLGEDGTPYIITKTGTEKSEIYRAPAPLPKDNATGVPMELAGEITLPKSTTENLLTVTGRLMITGAARSPDGSRVVLRTYADAFEWDVPDGDIVKALTTGKPRMTPLADAFGESIAYTPDGSAFVTVSDVGSLADDAEVVIQSYEPSTQVAAAPAAAGGTTGGTSDSGKSWTSQLTLTDITYLIGAVGVLGALLVGLGIFGIVRSRRKRAGEPGDPDGTLDADGSRNGRPGAGDLPADPPGQARGNTYGGGAQDGGWTGAPGGAYPAPGGGGYEPTGRPQPGVYGGQQGGGGGGAVYGGAPRPQTAGPGGGVYGGAGSRAPGGAAPDPAYGGGRGGYPPADPRGQAGDRRNDQPVNGYGQPRGGQYGQGRPAPRGYPENGYPEQGYPEQGYPEQGRR
ncbi:hypothetical protein [Micromonospora sp. NBC_01796]|uniref:hypothetical protein n=1 Tax=Micromonospora sp. NBC_01796 TaxID=2975987 RepID=UPI002DD7A6E6|nr:hypothetical protein [Micromonospora sp. NBC_01796]WSA86909.1 hypothetical protein OIE47_04625 [Micromonospora sp. NBC_01796]